MLPEQRLLNTVIGSTTEMHKPSIGFGIDLYGRARDVLDIVLSRMFVATSLPKTRLATIINEIDLLQRRTNSVGGYIFQPTKHAIRSAKSHIFMAYAKMGDAFPDPSFVLDGEQGIIIKWSKDGRTVRLNCFADPTDQDYIYFENGDYDVEDNITADKIQNRLNWLTQYERELAR
jgi:hypothetical protein